MEQIFDLDLEYLAEQLKVKKNIISSAIQKLSDSKALKIHEAVTTGNQSVSTGSPTYVRTNVRTNMSSFDFEAIYNLYPKKEGKTKGIEICNSRIKTKEDYDLLLKAVTRYSKNCREERKEKKFIKLFSSFMAVWRDYAYDEPTTPISINRAPSGPPPETPKEIPTAEAQAKVRDLMSKFRDRKPIDDGPGAA